MDLVRDLLDKQLIDRHGRRAGKVDGVVLDVRLGRPPRVAALEVGVATLARRVHPRLERWLAQVSGRRRPYRIPWARVRKVGLEVRVDLDATRTPIYALEHWLRRHVIGRIPGA